MKPLHGLFIVRSVAVALLAVAHVARAQTLTLDSSTGVYTLAYTGLDGASYAMLFPSIDRVGPSVEVVSITGSSLRAFRYRVDNRAIAGSVLPLESVAIQCPAVIPQLSARRLAQGITAHLSHLASDGRVCHFVFGGGTNDMIPPGSWRYGMEIVGLGLPAIVEGRAFGFAEMASIPSDPGNTPDTVYSLIERAQGATMIGGGGKAFFTVAPGRLPSEVPDIAAGVALAQLDRAAVCGSLAWITVDTTCTRLASYLSGDPVDLRGFLHYLTAYHPDGKPIQSNNAYYLLKAIAEYARSRVTSANLQVHYICGNRFLVRNYNAAGLPVRYEVVTPGEFGDLNIPARPAGLSYSDTEFTVTTAGRTRLYYDGMQVHYPLWEFRAC